MYKKNYCLCSMNLIKKNIICSCFYNACMSILLCARKQPIVQKQSTTRLQYLQLKLGSLHQFNQILNNNIQLQQQVDRLKCKKSCTITPTKNKRSFCITALYRFQKNFYFDFLWFLHFLKQKNKGTKPYIILFLKRFNVVVNYNKHPQKIFSMLVFQHDQQIKMTNAFLTLTLIQYKLQATYKALTNPNKQIISINDKIIVKMLLFYTSKT
eukprot:TRINITY_DN3453_c0_g4_i3.p3 TRINITY_DN3453_c0_g4~~TRINITY_DN3453_c0_g4_i3.p3  ORF type:complete len:211 (+),score=-10.89 TRINITY_DN3453_c0_g4_i3:1035-1667(+)